MKATPMTRNESLRSDYDEMINAQNAYKKQKLQFENRLYGRRGKFFMNAIGLLCILAGLIIIGLIFTRPRTAGEKPAMVVIGTCSLPQSGALSE